MQLLACPYLEVTMQSRLSGYFARQFKWPGRKFFYGYWCVVAMLALASAVDMIFVHPLTAVSVAPDPTSAFLHNLAGAGAMSLVLALLGGVFYVVIAMYYKMFVEIHTGWLKAKAALPGAIASMQQALVACRDALSATVNFIFSLPMRVASGYARWCALSALDKFAAIATVFAMLLLGCICWQMWTVATNLAARLPDWLDSADKLGNLRNVLFIDVMLSMLLFAVVMPFYFAAVKALGKALFKKS